MQVSQVSDQITHASVGSQETVEMGVSDSSALMHILSTALYTYPKLAAMREIMCNGWDANISNNMTHIPLRIIVSPTHVSVQDAGKGIPHEKIGEIYGTYGNSTKRDDSTVTGGFGLGSKAPFAYVDNFEVINCNQGTKTIYRVSKSSMQKGGKPAISKVVSLPTKESGITVKFALKPGDQENFGNLVGEIAALGEIPVLLNKNSETLPIIPLTQSETGYVITTYRPTIKSKIMVRYGNVVYPVPVADGYRTDWERVANAMEDLRSNSCVIFNCPPDTVSIQPSREALILTDGTVNTLRSLLSKFDTTVIKHSRTVIQSFYIEGLNIGIKNSPTDVEHWHRQMRNGGSTFNVDYQISRNRLKHLGNNPLGSVDFTLRNAALRYQASHYQGKVYTNHGIRQKVIEHIIRDGNLPSSQIKYFKELLHWDKAMYKRAKKGLTPWDDTGGLRPIRDGKAIYTKHVLKPFMEKFKSNPVLKEEALCFPGKKWGTYGEILLHTKFGGQCYSVDVDDWYFMFKPVVQIYTSVRFLKENMSRGPQYGRFAYHVPVKSKDREAIIKAFEDMGCDVKVLIAEPKERVYVVKEIDPNAPIPEPKKTVKRKGYLSLKSAWDSVENEWLLNTAREHCSMDPTLEIKKPVAWVILGTKGKGSSFAYFEGDIARLINRRWGNEIAVVTSVQAAKLTKEGVPDVQKYVYGHVDDLLSKSKDFPRYLAFGLHLGATRRQRKESLIFNMLGHKTLMDELGLRYHISMDTHVLTSFFEDRAEKMPLCTAMAQKVKKSPQVEMWSEKLKDSEWSRYINCIAVGIALDVYPPDSPQLAIPYELVRKLLK